MRSWTNDGVIQKLVSIPRKALNYAPVEYMATLGQGGIAER